MDTVEKVAETILYEGFLLYPYTRSALKNQQRWTFGGVYPRHYSEAGSGDDPWLMQTQCLLLGDVETEIHVKVRFLQIVDRTVADVIQGHPRVVESLRVGDEVYRPWEESVEREYVLGPLRLGDLAARSRTVEIAVPPERAEQALMGEEGNQIGALIRESQRIDGTIEVSVEDLADSDGQRFRLTVRIVNITWLADAGVSPHAAVLRHTLISTHTILRVHGGEFVSLLEPPDEHAAAAADCANIKTWPVLAGEPGDRHTFLSSPIILYDYPQIAPETPGDLFDATEIDELLRLSVMTLTDAEKQEMRETDPRTREILERTESLTPEQIMALHGSVRGLQSPKGGGAR